MTPAEFTEQQTTRRCNGCGNIGVVTELNPNNNGLLVKCSACGSNRPWGSLLYLKQNERKRAGRPPLPDGETLDSIWEKFDNRCVMCGAPKSALATLGIGRQVHHVIPYAAAGHGGAYLSATVTLWSPSVACLYWFYQRVVMKSVEIRSEGRIETERGDSRRALRGR